jgi:hypothetical protein
MNVEWLTDYDSVDNILKASTDSLNTPMCLNWQAFQDAVACWYEHLSESDDEDIQWKAVSLMYHIASANPISIQNPGDSGAQRRCKEGVTKFAFSTGIELLSIGHDVVGEATNYSQEVKLANSQISKWLRECPIEASKRDNVLSSLLRDFRKICLAIPSSRRTN